MGEFISIEYHHTSFKIVYVLYMLISPKPDPRGINNVQEISCVMGLLNNFIIHSCIGNAYPLVMGLGELLSPWGHMSITLTLKQFNNVSTMPICLGLQILLIRKEH